jgi:hypothetical protein
VADDLLLVGGRDPVTDVSQPYVALDARSGRMWGADDPRLFAKAGRDAAGRTVEVKQAVFGTPPIRFGRYYSPVVFDGGVFVDNFLLDLKEYLQAQFGRKTDNPNPYGAAAAESRKWPGPVQEGILMVAGDKVLIATRRLTAVSRSDGTTLAGSFDLPIKGAPLHDGVVVAENCVFIATTAGEIVCLASP